VAAFLARYAQVAHLDLVQAHAAGGTADRPRVWVEERRTMVLATVPCLAWYRGIVTLARSTGVWRIAGIDLTPEDLISVRYGGHQPWRLSAGDVAAVAVVARFPRAISSYADPFSSIIGAATASDDPGVRVVTVRGVDRRYAVRLAREVSGTWAALDVTPLGSPG
jgi:hypothetical protein